jgi:hypothetical protein
LEGRERVKMRENRERAEKGMGIDNEREKRESN